MFKKFVSSIVMVALILVTSGALNPFVATAAGAISTASDTMTRLKASTLSDHEFKFVTPTGVAVGQDITLTFSAGFTGVDSVVVADVDLAEGSTGVCSSAVFTERVMGVGTTQYDAVGAGQVVTITAGGTATAINAGRCVRIRIGENAADVAGSSAGPGTSRITNGAIGATDTITIGGTFTDTGVISIEIMDNDQVSVTASVDQTISFDLDTGVTVGENGPVYSVPLGTLSSGAVTRSNGTSINSIFADGGTNASGGMNVSVSNANGASGLVSTSTPADYIASTTITMSANAEKYGLCVDSATPTGWARSTTYTTTCTVDGATNGVIGLTTTPTDILTSSIPVTGHAQIIVNAAVASDTPAHIDYTDTLTFIATASF